MNTYGLVKLVPWRWKVWIVSITIILLLLILPYIVLAICNPFWFRNRMMKSCYSLLNFSSDVRFKLFKPAIEKYTLFDTLKSIDKNE